MQKKEGKKKSSIVETTKENIDYNFKHSIAETPSKNDDDDDINVDGTKSEHIPVQNPTTSSILTPQGYLSKSLDYSQNNQSNASAKWSLNSENDKTSDPNHKESIEQYKLRKFVQQQAKKIQHSLSHIPPPEMPDNTANIITQRQSLKELKKEQLKRKEKRKKRREKRRKRRKKRQLKK